MARTIDVVSLYPKDMNIYGDSGNVLTIRRRLELYGYEPVVHQYNQGDDWPDQVDLILGGGGQDTGQKKIIDDFYHRADLLRSLAADGTPMLMICGLYQLFGEYFETVDGTRLDGIGVIGAYTVGQNVRMIGNLVEHSDQFGDVIGYENHSGQTFLREGVQPLGTVNPRHQRFPYRNCRDSSLRYVRYVRSDPRTSQGARPARSSSHQRAQGCRRTSSVNSR